MFLHLTAWIEIFCEKYHYWHQAKLWLITPSGHRRREPRFYSAPCKIKHIIYTYMMSFGWLAWGVAVGQISCRLRFADNIGLLASPGDDRAEELFPRVTSKSLYTWTATELKRVIASTEKEIQFNCRLLPNCVYLCTSWFTAVGNR